MTGAPASPRFRDPRVEIRGASPLLGRRPVHTRGADEGGEAARQAGDRLGGFVLLDVGHNGGGSRIQSHGRLDEEPRKLPRGRQRASRRWPLRHAYCLVSGLTVRLDRLRPTLGDEAVDLPARAGVSARSDLTPQSHGVLTAFADPPHEVAHVHIEQARAGTMGQSGWEDVGRSVFAYSGASQPHRAGDPEQRLAARTPSMHLVVNGSLSRPALRPRVKLQGPAWEGVIAPGRKICRAGGGRQAPKLSMSTMKPAFDGLTHVGEEVPPIEDLQRSGRAEIDAPGIFTRAVLGDDPDVRPPFEPAGQRCRSAGREKVDHAMAVQVHHDRTVAAAFPHRPIVDADVDR